MFLVYTFPGGSLIKDGPCLTCVCLVSNAVGTLNACGPGLNHS